MKPGILLGSADDEHRNTREASNMTIHTLSDVSFGEQLPTFTPDTGLLNVKKFAVAAGWGCPSFYRPRCSPATKDCLAQ